MSSKLIKDIQTHVIATVQIMSDGTTEITAQGIHPQILCSSLFKCIMTVMYASFQPVEEKRIENPFDRTH